MQRISQIILTNDYESLKENLINEFGIKNLLLPTIRSRLMSQNLLEKKEQIKTGINWQKLDLKTLSEFVDNKIALERTGEFDKFRLKELICVITKECLAQGVKFSEFELSYINKLVVLCELNAKSHAVLLPLLLMISEKK